MVSYNLIVAWRTAQLLVVVVCAITSRLEIYEQLMGSMSDIRAIRRSLGSIVVRQIKIYM